MKKVLYRLYLFIISFNLYCQTATALEMETPILSVKSNGYQSSVKALNQLLDNHPQNAQKMILSTGRGKLHQNFQEYLSDLVSHNKIKSFNQISQSGSRPDGYEILFNPDYLPLTTYTPSSREQHHDTPIINRSYIFPKKDELNLHSKSVKKAHELVIDFIQNAAHQGKKQVLVITGKGNHGNRYKKDKNAPFKKGIIRTSFPQWMEETGIKEYVSSFSQAQSVHGGEGAYYVFLK